MGFKFLTIETPDRAREAYNRVLERRRLEDNNISEPNQLRLSVDNRPAVFLNLNRHRDTISNEEWLHLLRQQRIQLMEYMWDSGMVMNTIISQDEYGFTLRTELNF